MGCSTVVRVNLCGSVLRKGFEQIYIGEKDSVASGKTYVLLILFDLMFNILIKVQFLGNRVDKTAK